MPSASVLARRALRLFHECDRVDGLPEGPLRDEVLSDLLDRISRFRQEGSEEQIAALQEAMSMMG